MWHSFTTATSTELSIPTDIRQNALSQIPQRSALRSLAHALRGAQNARKEDTYHWALLIGPKTEFKKSTTQHFEAKERPLSNGTWEWYFNESTRSTRPTDMLLVRIMVAKIIDTEALIRILREISIQQNKPDWNCVAWVKEALERLKADADTDGQVVGRHKLEWELVRDTAMKYCRAKRRAHRFDGTNASNGNVVPTFDLAEGYEAE